MDTEEEGKEKTPQKELNTINQSSNVFFLQTGTNKKRSER
jgi:hypothetical protein